MGKNIKITPVKKYTTALLQVEVSLDIEDSDSKKDKDLVRRTKPIVEEIMRIKFPFSHVSGVQLIDDYRGD